MSIYRSFKRSPRSDVHHVAEHVTRPPNEGDTISRPPQPPQDWTRQRKANPAQTLFPATVRWIDSLPGEVQPRALSASFPRIANMLARLWSNTAGFTEYLNDLLVDRRGGRKGFPLEVLGDLNRLREYYGTLNPAQTAVWDDANRPR